MVYSSFFSLLRLALGTNAETADLDSLTKSEWVSLVDIAFEQGVAAILVEGLQNAGVNALLDSDELEDLRYEIFGEALASEEDYKKHQQVIERLADLFDREKIEMLLLKGYGQEKK